MRRGGVTAQTAEERKARSACSSHHVSPSPALHGKPVPLSSPAQPHPQCNMTLPVVLHLHNHTHNATWHFLLFFTQFHTACYTGSSEFTYTTTPTIQHDTFCCTLPAQPHPQCNMTLPVVLDLHNLTHNATWHFLLYFTCTTTPTMQHDTSCCYSPSLTLPASATLVPLSSPAQPHPQCNMTLPVVLHPSHSHTACNTGFSEFTCTTTPTMQHNTYPSVSH